MLDGIGDVFIIRMELVLISNQVNSRSSARTICDKTSKSNPVAELSSDASSGGSQLAPGVVPSSIVSPVVDNANATTSDKQESRKMIAAPSDFDDTVARGSPTVYDLSEERRQRENASIDAELEALLDQLSREQASSS